MSNLSSSSSDNSAREATCVVAWSTRRNGNWDADQRTSVMPAATNLGSYSDKSNFLSRPASVCGCFAPPPPPTLPPKIPHDAGPPSSPQEMSNMLSTGIYARGGGQCGGALALLQSGWVATAGCFA